MEGAVRYFYWRVLTSPCTQCNLKSLSNRLSHLVSLLSWWTCSQPLFMKQAMSRTSRFKVNTAVFDETGIRHSVSDALKISYFNKKIAHLLWSNEGQRHFVLDKAMAHMAAASAREQFCVPRDPWCIRFVKSYCWVKMQNWSQSY